MTGTVITEELNSNRLEAGAIVVLKDKESLQLCTIQHIDPDGHWVVMGVGFDNYTVPLDAELCKIVVIDDRRVYPLKFNQWAKAIKNKEVGTDAQVEFELVAAKFKEGKHLRVCGTCTAQFLGGRNQPDCLTCSEKNVTARIIINKTIKPKRPRVKSVTEIKALALTAYQMGMRAGHADVKPGTFNEWLDKQF
jgi:hypothetical protein